LEYFQKSLSIFSIANISKARKFPEQFVRGILGQTLAGGFFSCRTDFGPVRFRLHHTEQADKEDRRGYVFV
jgi:hypothetical protein